MEKRDHPFAQKYDFNEINFIIKDYWSSLANQQGNSKQQVESQLPQESLMKVMAAFEQE